MRQYLHTPNLKSAFMVIGGVLIYLAALSTPVQAGNYFRYDKDIQGQVIDDDTQQPLAGVVVMVMWVTEHTRITIEPEERYYDYFETLTDANGEFNISGKGQNFFRNMPPPKIAIYKVGYPMREIHNFVYYPDLPLQNVRVIWKDGKRTVFYKKMSAAQRKKYVQHYRQIPYSKMARAQVPSDKYRLYSAELARDYEVLGMRQYQPQTGAPLLIFKEGGVYPATHQSVSPQKSQRPGGGVASQPLE